MTNHLSTTAPVCDSIPAFPNILRDFPEFFRTSENSNEQLLVFFHDDCDGWVAAACIYDVLIKCRAGGRPFTCLGNIKFVPIQYGYKRDDVLKLLEPTSNEDQKTNHCFVLDFSFDRELCEIVRSKTKSMLILDHHKSAQAELKDLPYACFRMHQSGALMTFNFVYGEDTPVPTLVRLADNRDLWKKTDGREDALNAWFFYEKNQQNGQIESFLLKLAIMLKDDPDEGIPPELFDALQMGESMIRKRDSDIKSACSVKNIRHTVIGGYPAIAVNYGVNQSDACEYLYSQPEFKDKIIACWSVTAEDAVFSLRKNADLKVDLSEIAAQYGGGGHAAAAGFKVSVERGMNIVLNKEKWALCWEASQVDQQLSSFIETYEQMATGVCRGLSELTPMLLSRATVETDFTKLQILPYILIRDAATGCYFTYRRPVSGTEKRLHGNMSIGAGGHIDTYPAPGVSISRHIGEEAARELKEELGIDSAEVDVASIVSQKFDTGQFFVLRLKGAGDVERVHLGLAFIVDVPDSSVLRKINTDEVINPEWWSIQLLQSRAKLRNNGDMECWTHFLCSNVLPLREAMRGMLEEKTTRIPHRND